MFSLAPSEYAFFGHIVSSINTFPMAIICFKIDAGAVDALHSLTSHKICNSCFTVRYIQQFMQPGALSLLTHAVSWHTGSAVAVHTEAEVDL